MAKALKIASRRDSFRRAGRSFGPEPVIIPISDLKEGDLETIMKEPMLVVVETEIPDEVKDSGKAKKGKGENDTVPLDTGKPPEGTPPAAPTLPATTAKPKKS